MKLPLFRKTTMHKLETAVAALADRDGQLAAKRVTAQQALDKAVKARQDALLSGDLDDQRAIDKLQAAVDSAASALVGIDDAISILAQQKVEAEGQLAAERERVKRSAAADKLAAKIAAIEATLPKYLAQSRVFTDALSEIAGHHYESAQMAQFVQNAAAQVELASNFALADLKNMPERIKTGELAMPRDQPEPEPIKATEAPPETQRLFSLRSVKWTDDNGQQRYGLQYTDVDLPPVAAQRALRRNVAVPVTDPRRRDLKGARGGYHVDPNAPDIVDLDDGQTTCPPHFAPVTNDPHAKFMILDRSAENRTLQIEVPRL